MPLTPQEGMDLKKKRKLLPAHSTIKGQVVLLPKWVTTCSVGSDSLQAHQAPLSMGFSRQEYWNGLQFPSPRDLSDPGIEPRSPVLYADSLPSEPLEKPPNICKSSNIPGWQSSIRKKEPLACWSCHQQSQGNGSESPARSTEAWLGRILGTWLHVWARTWAGSLTNPFRMVSMQSALGFRCTEVFNSPGWSHFAQIPWHPGVSANTQRITVPNFIKETTFICNSTCLTGWLGVSAQECLLGTENSAGFLASRSKAHHA